MHILLSPAKTLDESPIVPAIHTTTPDFTEQTYQLVALLRTYSSAQLGQMMDISDKLAQLNVARYQSFPDTLQDCTIPALMMFQGDVYKPIPAHTYDAQTLEFAQQHLRILSGLYGLLRPLDCIAPYRLEMGTNLPNPHGTTLYQFWGRILANALNTLSDAPIINLASQEYSKAVDQRALKRRWINVEFKELKAGKAKIVGIHAKRARGLMTHWILSNHLDTYQALPDFAEEGYQYHPDMSDENTLVFARATAQ